MIDDALIEEKAPNTGFNLAEHGVVVAVVAVASEDPQALESLPLLTCLVQRMGCSKLV